MNIYYRTLDIGISHTLSRRFFWADNALWKEDIQGHRVGIVLAGKDIVVDTKVIVRYLTDSEKWESRNDIYRDTLARGGKKHNAALHKFLLAGFAGPGAVEDMPSMLPKRPFYGKYWASKYIHTENIDVPLYVVASYSPQLHSRGAFHTFRTAKSPQKWLRVHPYQEWHDLYRPESVDDLHKYFDRFLKGIKNDWEKDTPRVRLSLLGFKASGGIAPTVCERPETEWPLARQDLTRLYLTASTMMLEPQSAVSGSFVSHEANDMYASSVSDVFVPTWRSHLPAPAIVMPCSED